MLIMLLWRKVSSSVTLQQIFFAFHCISRRKLVVVCIESGVGFITISPTHYSRSRSRSACIDRYAAKKAI